LVFIDSCTGKKRNHTWVAVLTSSSKNCILCDRLQQAIKDGASAIIIINSPGPGRGYPISLQPSQIHCKKENMNRVGILSMGESAAFELLEIASANPQATVSIKIISTFREFISRNVYAKSINGDPNNIAMFGSHLDSVVAGPGINDDGSGLAATLELASQFHHHYSQTTRSQIRFAWWTGEGIYFYLLERLG
jgi:hypothetical protein